VSTGRRSTGDDEGQAKPPAPERLHARPGFLLRRAHQISVALFLEEAGAWSITTSQYGALLVLAQADGELDIVGLGRRLGMDRSTTALVVSKLEAAGWVAMQTNPIDRRRKALTLTPAGRATLETLSGPARSARERLLSAFTPEEAEQFLGLLRKFVETFDGVIRTPIGP
jgi:DNA-binding MarR family transcriptional regulator